MTETPLIFTIGNTIISLIIGDITDQDTDAVVNAANKSLMGGGGVDGAIHAKGGPGILEECKQIRQNQYPDGLPTGMAVITSGGNLKAHYIIHTVGPVWNGGKHGEPQLLRDAYTSSLDLAVKNDLKSISFPSISTGAYCYPLKEAVNIVLFTLKEYLGTDLPLEEVRLVLHKPSDFQLYCHAATEIFVNPLRQAGET
ncbi:MAG: O-acetyl-ADP-ribose deacetylase [ANME-2 cluster archaeon]|nr:O-acetyl-ADP-ribose deacetylase [ANME-2 cluster archaeon]